MVYDRDYGPEEVEQMRKLAKDHMTLTLDKAYKKFNGAYQKLDSYEQKKVIAFLYNDYTTLPVDYIGKYLNVSTGSLKEHTENMLAYDSLFSKFGSSRSGAFTTTIGDRSYCFFGREYQSVSTVIHEAGHYYASRFTDLGSIPLDLAEVHSQGNEMMFMANVGKTMKASEFSAIINYNMYNNVAMILICLMVDEFEQIVYSKKDISKFTAADFDAIMDSVVSQYMDVNYARII
jgi:hypothetical protein